MKTDDIDNIDDIDEMEDVAAVRAADGHVRLLGRREGHIPADQIMHGDGGAAEF